MADPANFDLFGHVPKFPHIVQSVMVPGTYRDQPDGPPVFRYRLSYAWELGKPRVVFIMLNPSTATSEELDPTARHCCQIAYNLGFGGVEIANLFAFRSTDPKNLKHSPDPIGPDNDRHLLELVREHPYVVCAWGTHGDLWGRAKAVQKLLTEAGVQPKVLGLTKDGFPKHPLARGKERIPATTVPQAWRFP